MSTYKKKVSIFESEKGAEIEQALRLMATDSTYNTTASYVANTAVYPDNRITFVEKHMNYLNNHQDIDPDQYLSNLRLIARIRR